MKTPRVETATEEYGRPEILANPLAALGDSSAAQRFSKVRLSGFRLFLVCLDIATLGGLYTGSLVWRHGASFSAYFYPGVLLVLFPIPLIFLALVGGYDLTHKMRAARFISEHLIASLLAFFIVVTLIYAGVIYRSPLFGSETDQIPARANVMFTLLAFPVISIAYRRVAASSLEATLSQTWLYVIGAGSSAVDLYNRLRADGWPHRLVFFDPSGDREGECLVADDPGSPTVHGDLFSELETNASEVEAIVIAQEPTRLPSAFIDRLLRVHLHWVPVLTLDNFASTYWRTVPVSEVTAIWAFADGFALHQSLPFDRLKRLVDIALATGTLFVFAPFMALIALLIRLESRGPAIFRQSRVGWRGRPFTLYKFRTMTAGSEDGNIYTREKDPRITGMGQWLRRTRIDELPQLWNVLKGAMSVIGPRAEWTRCVEIYEKEIPYYHFRHFVKPGITGWAQVNHSYGESTEDAVLKLNYDLYYVRHHSFALDFTICLKSMYIVLFGKGR